MIAGLKDCAQLGISHTEQCPTYSSLPQEQKKPSGLISFDIFSDRSEYTRRSIITFHSVEKICEFFF